MPSGYHEYPPAAWRLLIDPTPRSGAWNMALDEVLMERVAAAASPPTLRFYMWDPPCLSLGKRQPLNGVALDRCRADGVSVVRRVTGGWAILHTDELTYSIAVRPDDPRADGAILDAYRKLSQGLVVGLSLLGAPAVMNPVALGGTQNLSAACFEVPSAYEITVGQRKLIGSAQTRPAGRVLQHGSLPLTGDIARVTEYLWFESADARAELRDHLRERATTLSEALGRPVAFAEAAEAMASGFATALSLDLAPGDLSAEEWAAVELLLPTKTLEHPVSAGTS
ncbi:MAG: lipoate--protein ligase family protein [Ktedonobacterales bacterium]